MKLGFKAGFVTTLGILAAFYLYSLVTLFLNQLVINPLIRALLG